MKSIAEAVLFPPFCFRRRALTRAVAGKTALITGASYGIGRALAELLQKAGIARLLLVARSEDVLAECKQGWQRAGLQVEYFACDLQNRQQRKALLAHWKEERIDFLIHNAGKSIRRPLYQSLERLHDFERTMQLNYFAPVELTLAFLPKMPAGAKIIHSSAANVLLPPAPYWAAYQASKTAFEQFLRCADAELASKGIGVSHVYLPLVRTRMIAPTKAYRQAAALEPERAARWMSRALYRKSRSIKPWWLFPLEVLGLCLRPLWEGFLAKRFLD